MKKLMGFLIAFCFLACLYTACMAEAEIEPEPTVPPLEASTAEFIFGGDIEAVNAYVHEVMEGIGGPVNFFTYSMTQWPIAMGTREPQWDDFAPNMPNYVPAFLTMLQQTEDEDGTPYVCYFTELLDLTFEDWGLEVTNGEYYYPCEYESPYFYSDWLPQEELDFQGLVLYRNIAPNVMISFNFGTSGSRTQTSVSWEDEDYSVEWVWHYEEGWYGTDDANLLKLTWKDKSGTIYVFYDANEGYIMNAMTAMPRSDDE